MEPIKSGHNDTTTFLLPIMFPNITHIELFTEYFKQAYIGFVESDDFDDTLILDFDEDESIDSTFLEEYCSGDILNVKEQSVVTSIPSQHEDDYEKFLTGRYSELSKESKKKIVDFWEEDEESLLYGILHKTDKAKDLLLSQVDTKYKHRVSKGLDKRSVEFWRPPNIIANELKGD